MSEIAIKLENISKRYRLGLIGTNTLAGDLQAWWYRMRGKPDPTLIIGEENKLGEAGGDYIWAIKDINLEVKKGEILGIIGKNGAGKSTLLKILSRVTGPTTGSIKVNGRIASLLEVGTGFHPELTGRENVFLNGAILGMTKDEITGKFDEIVDFAGIAKYIDTPVKRYSSGMRVRLGFAVAAFLEPEILVVDEVLAVGDAEFQKKAIGKMQDISKGENGRTVLFVSHNMASISNLCENVIVLENGTIHFVGNVNKGINYYLKNSNQETNTTGIIKYPKFPNKNAQILEIKMLDEAQKVSNIFKFNLGIELKMLFEIQVPDKDYYVVFYVTDIKNNILFVSADDDKHISKISNIKKGVFEYSINLPKNILKPGFYALTVSLTHVHKKIVDKKENVLEFEIVDVSSYRSLKGKFRNNSLIAPELDWNLAEIVFE